VTYPSWIRWAVGGAVVLVLSVAVCCGCGINQLNTTLQDAQNAMKQAQANAEADRKARTVAVKAADLLQEFKTDPAAADRKYKGKCLEISGVVERTSMDGDGVPFIILHAGDEQSQLKIECFFDDELGQDDARVQRLTKGQAITVRGEYNGRVSHVQIRGCVLVK
jgi:hypothetical protein